MNYLCGEHIADTSAEIHEGMIAKRILDGIIQNKYSQTIRANSPRCEQARCSLSIVDKNVS